MVSWEDNIYDALLMLKGMEFKGSWWMPDDHPEAKHQRYLERQERRNRKPRKKRRR